MTDRELWTIAQVAEHLGVKPASARGQLTRWGIPRAGTGESASGRITALYDAEAVRAATDGRPGAGRRTDLA